MVSLAAYVAVAQSLGLSPKGKSFAEAWPLFLGLVVAVLLGSWLGYGVGARFLTRPAKARFDRAFSASSAAIFASNSTILARRGATAASINSHTSSSVNVRGIPT